MQEISTPSNKTDLTISPANSADLQKKMQPSDSSIQKIMQFASNYRVQKINENQYVEIFLS